MFSSTLASAARRSWFGVWLLLCLLMLGAAHARADDEFLDPAAAFKFSARMQDGATIAVTYQIADGYYMYRERFKFEAAGARLGVPSFPPGKVKFDETFQKNVETYRHGLTITIPVEGAGPFTLTTTSQGCSEKGLCYAPQEAKIRLTAAGGAPGQTSASGNLSPAPASEPGKLSLAGTVSPEAGTAGSAAGATGSCRDQGQVADLWQPVDDAAGTPGLPLAHAQRENPR